jgi:hypothetical protein
MPNADAGLRRMDDKKSGLTFYQTVWHLLIDADETAQKRVNFFYINVSLL